MNDLSPFASPIFSLRRNGKHVATVMVFKSAFGKFIAGFSSHGGFKQTEAEGETPVEALYAVAAQPCAIEHAHEIKVQAIGRMQLQ